MAIEALRKAEAAMPRLQAVVLLVALTQAVTLILAIATALRLYGAA